MSSDTGAPEAELSCPGCGTDLIVITRKDWEEIIKEMDDGKPSWQAEDVPEKPYYKYTTRRPKSRFVYRYNK